VSDLGPFIEAFAPFLALAALLGALVFAINLLGRRLERHDEWLNMLDTRVGNLDKDRKATWAKELQRPYGAETTERALVPPPLPPRAPTLNAVDWEEELVDTEELQKKQTGRYPLGEPPKGPNDDDTST
jgi:hypothetical protein